jgi:hypothetical protein
LLLLPEFSVVRKQVKSLRQRRIGPDRTSSVSTPTFDKLGEDPISGEIKYDKFSSGIDHKTETVMNFPGKNAIIYFLVLS